MLLTFGIWPDTWKYRKKIRIGVKEIEKRRVTELSITVVVNPNKKNEYLFILKNESENVLSNIKFYYKTCLSVDTFYDTTYMKIKEVLPKPIEVNELASEEEVVVPREGGGPYTLYKRNKYIDLPVEYQFLDVCYREEDKRLINVHFDLPNARDNSQLNSLNKFIRHGHF